MNFSQFLRILRARYKIVLLVLSLTVLTALVVSLMLPKTYKATATLVLNYKGIDPVTGVSLPSQLMPGYMTTQVDIITSMNVALQVVDDLKLAEGAVIHEKFMDAMQGKGSIREWRAAQLLKKLEVAPSRESSVLSINFSDRDPQIAASIANAFAANYQNLSIRLRLDPSKKAAGYFNEQVRLLRDKFEEAQKKMTRYQQDNGIVTGDNRMDIESARLSELSSQLVNVQGQLMEASSRRNQAQGSGAGDSPDVVGNALIQNLRLQLAQAESRFSGIAARLTQDHPQYQAAKAEVDKLRTDLNRQIRIASNSVANSEQILQRRESELRAALETQKAKVQDLNRKRDELKVLNNELENAQRSYESATQRYTQTNIEGQSNQSDIALLNAATPPMVAASPKIMLNTLLAMFLGTILGIGFAMLAELLDRRVRSVDDLVDGLQAPVLGVVVWGEPKQPRLGLQALLLPNRSMPN